MRDDDERQRQTVKIELLSQWKLEAEFRNTLSTSSNMKDKVSRKLLTQNLVL